MPCLSMTPYGNFGTAAERWFQRLKLSLLYLYALPDQALHARGPRRLRWRPRGTLWGQAHGQMEPAGLLALPEVT
jgi:hypothetical protein